MKVIKNKYIKSLLCRLWGLKESDTTERLTSSNILEMATMKWRIKHPWPYPHVIHSLEQDRDI